MRVQYRASATSRRDHDVQKRFRGRPASAWLKRCAAGINLDEVVGGQGPLCDTAARHQQPEGITSKHDAEVAARSKNPITRIEPPAHLGELPGRIYGLQPHDTILRRLSAQGNSLGSADVPGYDRFAAFARADDDLRR